MSGFLDASRLVVTVALVGGCGERFEAAGAGGAGNAPAEGGASGSGGTSGSGGGVSPGGSPGSGGGPGGTFPGTRVLDGFDREDGELGPSWSGAVEQFAIEGQALVDVAGQGAAAFWGQRFGANQEVFATLAQFEASSPEINLILKAQAPTDCEYLEVMYRPDTEQVGIAFCTNDSWTDLERTPLVLAPGDVLGARFSASGQIEVFQNSVRFMIVNVPEYPHLDGGMIGVNSLGGSARWDDFGGGDSGD